MDQDGNQFSVPRFLSNPGELKIHDWYFIAGCISAYVLTQMPSMDKLYRRRLTKFFFAMELLTFKK